MDLERVFKKSSKNKTLTLFLGKRDYVDHVDTVDVVDGVIQVDPAALLGKKVYIQLACAFRYGSDDLDVIGLSFRKDIWFKKYQIYPADHNPEQSPMHSALLKKAGDQGQPFSFQMPPNLPCSVTLQPGPGDKGKPCGVDFEVKAYIAKAADNPDDETFSKKDKCRLIIRKIQFAPDPTGTGPKADICRNFMMSDKPVYLEASLEKEIYYHGEPIPVKLKIRNETSKTVKKINILVDQTADVVLYCADRYTKNVLNQEFADTVEASGTYEKTLTICPLLVDNIEKRGLALDGRLKDEDTNMASTTMLRGGMERDVLGILVSYKIKINLIVSGGGLLGGLTASDVTAELPFILMHPKPEEINLDSL
uniref:Arrestin-C n=1 Tax=Maurolicus muelleri TaxID=68502 RepID=A0A2H4T6T5_9TELE|nr:arrestin 3a [Maurolicus muelleri]